MVLRREPTGVALSPEQMAVAEASQRATKIAADFFQKWPGFEFHISRDLARENLSAKYMEAKRQFADLRQALGLMTRNEIDLPEFSQLLNVNLEGLEQLMQKDFGEPGLALIGRLSVLFEALEQLTGRSAATKTAEFVQDEETEATEEEASQAA